MKIFVYKQNAPSSNTIIGQRKHIFNKMLTFGSKQLIAAKEELEAKKSQLEEKSQQLKIATEEILSLRYSSNSIGGQKEPSRGEESAAQNCNRGDSLFKV
jgi:hypothetical protein